MSKPDQYQKMPTIQVVHIKDIKAFKALREAWNLLLQKNPHRDAFLTWEWLYAWWKIYRKQRELWLITTWISNELVGVAPLMLEERRKYGLRMRALCSLGTPDMDVGGFIVRDDDSQIYAVLLDYLIAQKALWDILELNLFMLDGPEIEQLIPYFHNAGFAKHQKNSRHFYLPIQGDWHSYMGRLNPSLRGDLRRKVHRIEKQGQLTFKHHSGQEVTRRDISTIFEINKYGRYTYLYKSREERAFQRELLALMSDRGWPDIFFLYINDQPVAYNYGFIFNGKFEAWRNGFNTQYFELSVGKVLLMLLIEDCFKRAYEGVDFLRGDENYKTHWQIQERTYTQLRFVAINRPLPLIAYIWLPKLKSLLNRRASGNPQVTGDKRR